MLFTSLDEIHDRETGRRSGRPKPELEALKRAALILTVTAWASFVEDTAKVTFGYYREIVTPGEHSVTLQIFPLAPTKNVGVDGAGVVIRLNFRLKRP